MYETSCQSRFDARYWMLGASALGRPREMEWGGRKDPQTSLKKIKDLLEDDKYQETIANIS